MAVGDKLYNLEINDSEYERIGWQRGRYLGTKITSKKINVFTPGDKSFGKTAVIDKFSRSVYVFSRANNSFETPAGQFYPSTDEFTQTLPQQNIEGATAFNIDRIMRFY